MANKFGWDRTKRLLRDKIQSGAISYAADAGSNDTYVVTLDPIPTAYTTGMVIQFKANTINTGAATLNVNGLGAKNILKNKSVTLADGDIAAGQIVTVVYDGTQFQMQSQTATGVETGDSPTFINLTLSGTAYIGDTANANVTQGLTINQGASDDEILALKSSDVSHTVTTDTEADTYLLIKKNSATAGGALVRGLTDVDAEGALVLEGIIGATDPTDTNAALVLVGSKQSGTTTAALGAAETVMQLKNRTTGLITVLGDGATTFAAGIVATTLKATSGAAAAVVVSDSDGNLSADTTPALGTPSSGDLQNCTLATPSVKGVATLPTLTNLLTNSQGKAWSGSGLTQGLTVGRTTDFNVSNIYTDADGSTFASWTGSNLTITDGGANLLLTATATAAASATLTPTTFVVDKLYKVSIITANGTHSWDNATDSIGATSNAGVAIAGASIALNAGTNSFIWKATETNNKITITIGAITDTQTLNITSIYVDEVTPGYVAADTLAPDTMTKTATLDIHREWNAASANTYGYGTFLFKLTKGADTAEYLNFGTAIDYRDCQGKAVALGCYVYSLTANDNIKLSIHDGLTEVGLSSAYVTNDAVTWVELTATLAAGATALTPRILCDGDTADVAYISEPILVRGSSIGAGNFQPIPNEVIWLQTPASSTTSTLVSAAATLKLEALYSGKIGKGVKAVNLTWYGSNSAAAKYLVFGPSSGKTSLVQYSQVNAQAFGLCGFITCDSNGDIYVAPQDANFTTTELAITAIQT